MRHLSSVRNGNGGDGFGHGGFTLIELIVVIALLSIMLFTAVPRFQEVMTDDTRAVSRWILWSIPELKQQAVTEKYRFTLNVGLNDNKLWITHETMDEEQLELAADAGYVFPEDIELLDVEFPDGKIITTGTAEINFYPKGYSDRAIIHVATEDDERLSYFIEPFLTYVKLLDSYVGYDD